jgi:hypothetical protein
MGLCVQQQLKRVVGFKGLKIRVNTYGGIERKKAPSTTHGEGIDAMSNMAAFLWPSCVALDVR